MSWFRVLISLLATVATAAIVWAAVAVYEVADEGRRQQAAAKRAEQAVMCNRLNDLHAEKLRRDPTYWQEPLPRVCNELVPDERKSPAQFCAELAQINETLAIDPGNTRHVEPLPESCRRPTR